jgi:hypothetical protein
MLHRCHHLVVLTVAALPCGWALGDEAGTLARIHWLSDYRAAMDEARAENKMVLVWFQAAAESSVDHAFEAEVLNQPRINQRLGNSFVAVRVPVDGSVIVGHELIELLAHPAFAELHRRPGLAIVDLTDDQSPQYGHVVSVFPFSRGRITADKLAVLLDLPVGSLTERTLTFAVRAHPDRPASAWAGGHPVLAEETRKHAQHQASLTFQGHHNWPVRFHSISARLPAGLVVNEVCAESWPGQTLVEAAEECVDSWRQSSGHWNHVNSAAEYFGYDMRRGRNGVWYAAGIVARRRN